MSAQYVPFRNEMGILTLEEVRELIHVAFFFDLDLEDIPDLEDNFANELSIEIEGETFELYIVSKLNFISVWNEETEEINLFNYHFI